MQITAVIAVANDGALGLGGSLPWPRLPRDLARFREATMGKVCIVGRKTYTALPPLKGRRLAVLTRSRNSVREHYAAVIPRTSLEEIVLCAKAEPEVMVIGGAEVYRLAWPRLDRILLTVVDGTHPADTYLDPPGVLCEGFTCLSSQRHDPDADNPLGVVFSEWVRRV